MVPAFVTASPSWGGGDSVDEEDDGDVATGAESWLEDAGDATAIFAPPRAGPAAVLAGFAMDWEAAVTSWLKLAGPLAFFAVGLSCLVDHCRRC